MTKEKFSIKGMKIPHSKIFHYDVIILGGGPAGLTASIYSARYGLKTCLISKDIGGMANLSPKIENYPGYNGSGFELMQKFYKQAREHGAEFLNDDVIKLEKDSNGFIVFTAIHKIVHTRSIIITLGTEKRKLNIKGEDKFLGKGVSYCATCDGAFFQGKEVAVIGGSDAACMAALILSGLAKKVYIIYRKGKVRCEEIVIEQREKKKKIKLDGMFIEVGSLPLSDIAKILNVKIDKQGYIIVDHDMQTGVKGVFAAGDVVKSKLKQVVVAASQGAIAAKSAYEYLGKKK